MAIHCIIEPAGTLLTGWGLVPEDAPGFGARAGADRRNADEGLPDDPAHGDRTPAPIPVSKWELRKVG